MRIPNRLRPRCGACGMRQDLCVCDFVPRHATATRVVVILNYRELASTSNSGRLVTVALANSEWRVRGGHYQLDEKDLIPAGTTPLLLFPKPDSVPLDRAFLDAHPGPYTLVVPDGTWNQAKKICKREKVLASAIPVHLVEPGVSTYRLRIAPKEGALATFEAITRAMGVLEGAEVQKDMQTLFDEFVRRCLEARQPPPGTPPMPPVEKKS